MPINRLKYITGLALAVITLATGQVLFTQESQNVSITSAATPVCDEQSTGKWRSAVQHQLGVDAEDPESAMIGPFPAKKTVLGLDNWFPLNDRKQVLCGTLDHFNFFDGFGDEADWNNFFFPNERFAFILEEPRASFLSKDWHDCAGREASCLEAEVTPDERRYENILNSKSSDRSRLEGRELCTYGPWVREAVHGNRPEIHPSELYWWREDFPGQGFSYALLPHAGSG